MQVLLASRSPRRRWLLESAGLSVEVVPADVDESAAPTETPRELAGRLAGAKAWAAQPPLGQLVVAADTVVALHGTVLGKPADDGEAVSMLRRLSGRAHEVLTGYCVRRGADERRGVVQTEVWFRELTDAEIERYVQTGEAADKAGAYGIQGDAAAFVDRVVGSLTSVIGLPLTEVLRALRELEPGS